MVVGRVAVLVSGFYGFSDELPLILAFFKLYSQVFACFPLLLHAAFKLIWSMFEMSGN